MQGVGDQLLAGAALPDDQDAAARRRHQGELMQHLLHRLRRADDGAEGEFLLQPLPELADLLRQTAFLDRRRHALAQLDQVDRLLEVVVGAVLHGIHGRLHRSEAGDHQDRQPGVDRLGELQDLQSVHARHPQIGDQEVDAALLQMLDPAGTRGEGDDVVPVLAQRQLDAPAVPLVIVDDDDLPLRPGHSSLLRRVSVHPRGAPARRLSGGRRPASGTPPPRSPARPGRGPCRASFRGRHRRSGRPSSSTPRR